MNDFESHLGVLLDDVADGINPRPDFDAVCSATVPIVSNRGVGSRRFRGAIAIAAASALVLGAGVAASQLADGEPSSVLTDRDDTPPPPETVVEVDDRAPAAEPDGPRMVVPLDRKDRAPSDEREISDAARTAELGGVLVDGTTLVQTVRGRAAAGEPVAVESEAGPTAVGVATDGKWQLAIKLSKVTPGESVPIRVTFGWSDVVVEFVVRHPGPPIDIAEPATTEPPSAEPVEPAPSTTEPKQETPADKPADEPKPDKPKDEPKEEPAAVPFTTRLGDAYDDERLMKQVFFGTAPVGAVITASSEWGAVDTTSNQHGHWEMRLVLEDVPDDTIVHVVVGSNTGPSTFEYDLVRSKPAPEPDPEPKAFTSNPGGSHLGANPMKQGFYGTGTPGSVVIATTEYGSADAEVGPKGHWEMWLKMYEVPAGTVVHVRITNNASDQVFEYELERPAEPEPVEFTAQAAYVECDATPPYNEYWGTAPAGATVTISSPYGGAEVTSDGGGHWEARVEFPEAPIGETFIVRLSSSSGGPVKELPFKRVEPS